VSVTLLPLTANTTFRYDMGRDVVHVAPFTSYLVGPAKFASLIAPVPPVCWKSQQSLRIPTNFTFRDKTPRSEDLRNNVRHATLQVAMA